MDLFTEVKRDYDEDFARKLETLLRDPRYAGRVTASDTRSPLSEGQQGGQLLTALFSGQQPVSQLPGAFRMVLTGLKVILQHQTQLHPDNVPSRPRVDLLIEGGEAFATALETASQKMTNVNVNPQEFRALLALIVLSRSLVKPYSFFGADLFNNLAVIEDRAAKMMKAGYDLIRPVAQVDTQLGELLELTEEYFYGPAKQAAATTKEKKATVEELQTEAEKRAKLAARKDAHNLAADELSGLADAMRVFASPKKDLEDKPPLPSSDDRRNPR